MAETASFGAPAKTYSWPEPPYKGFSAYGPDDTPLFWGRNDDVLRLAYMVTHPNNRVVFVVGPTGCGKTSFLRAGLIPYLERDARITFLRETRSMSPLFIQCTEKPLHQLAKKVYAFCNEDVTVTSPYGDQRSVGLKSLVASATEQNFISHYGNDPVSFVELLEHIAARLPSTFAFIVDQAEELLTINRTEQGDVFRENFISFLAEFESRTLDLRVIITLRKEWFHDFHAALEGKNQAFVFRTFPLGELSKHEMAAAIRRPTLKEAIEGLGVPYDHYKFDFREKDLPEKIVNNVCAGFPKGGALLVLQVICDRLYSNKKPNDSSLFWEITKDDYESLGSLEGQVLDCLDIELRKMAYKYGKDASLSASGEVFNWKKAFNILVLPQADGTVVKVLKSREQIEESALQNKCKVPIDIALAYLADDSVRILKKESVVKAGTSETIDCYSLTHDAIALALHYWQGLLKEVKVERMRALKSMGYAALGMLPIILPIVREFNDGWLQTLVVMILIYGYFFLSLAIGQVGSKYISTVVARNPRLLSAIATFLPSQMIKTIMANPKRKETLRLVAPSLYDLYLQILRSEEQKSNKQPKYT